MDWRYNTIWFEQLKQDKLYEQDFKEKSFLSDNFSAVEYAILWYFKTKGLAFEKLPESKKLLYLELNWANIKNFQAIGKYKNLKRLEIHYCTKLEDDTGIKSLRDTLEYLHVNQSKKFIHTDELIQLKHLKVLCLNSCGQIDNLKFLNNFPNLIDFRFVNTNIMDGDLTPILEHPTIKTVGFLNKLHYNLTDQEIKSELSLKWTEEYRDILYKGEHLTYKYKYD